MSSHTEKWTGPDGRTYTANIHPEKNGLGDAKVFQVGTGSDYRGHITVHGDGSIHRHGIFENVPFDGYPPLFPPSPFK